MENNLTIKFESLTDAVSAINNQINVIDTLRKQLCSQAEMMELQKELYLSVKKESEEQTEYRKELENFKEADLKIKELEAKMLITDIVGEKHRTRLKKAFKKMYGVTKFEAEVIDAMIEKVQEQVIDLNVTEQEQKMKLFAYKENLDCHIHKLSTNLDGLSLIVSEAKKMGAKVNLSLPTVYDFIKKDADFVYQVKREPLIMPVTISDNNVIMEQEDASEM